MADANAPDALPAALPAASARSSVVPDAGDAPDRTLKRLLFRALRRLSAPGIYSSSPRASAGGETSGADSSVKATWRLFKRIFQVDRRLQTRAEMLHQALIDLALTKEQQEVFEKVLACNVRFWQIAVEGHLDGKPPWRRHVALNLALLRTVHRYLAAERIEAKEALKYCHWTLALYEGYAAPEETSATEEESRANGILALVTRTAGASEIRVLSSDLDNDSQTSDPLCPRFVLAMDKPNSELILCVRGTQTLSDLFADLIGDTEDFAGGQAHAGILHSSHRVLEKILEPLQQGLEELQQSMAKAPRLVLVGHSLGAGVCQLLAVLLVAGSEWTLPESVLLRCFLFAPPPVFGLEPKARGWSSFDFGRFFRNDVGRFRGALEKVSRASIAFTVNFDIIPRTSLHNGYKLFQEARLLDDAVPWGKAEVLRRLSLSDDASQVALASELQQFMAHVAKTKPAPSNPYAAQHAIADRLFQLMLVPGGTSAMQLPRSDQAEDSKTGSSREKICGRLQKRSQHLKVWRSRYAWIEAGELRFAPNVNEAPTTSIALTADSTSVTLLGDTSEEPLCLSWDLACSARPSAAVTAAVAAAPSGAGSATGSGRRSFLGHQGWRGKTLVTGLVEGKIYRKPWLQVCRTCALSVVLCFPVAPFWAPGKPSSAMASPPRTFHRRPLPAPAVAFSSPEGRRLFAEALERGTLGCFFRLIEQFHTQGEPAYCGLGTLAMVLNALGVDPKRVWKGPWRWFSEQLLDCCEPLEVVKERGITFSKVACLARCNGAHVDAQRADSDDATLEAFRKAVMRTCESEAEEENFQVMIVSYSRKALGQTGDGHYSPIGGYHAETDQVLILDVARFKYPPHWVPLTTLWSAMRYVDAETGRSRGYMVLKSNACLESSRMALTWRWPECSEDAKNADSTISGSAEILRRSLRFIDSPRMPLMVVCKIPDPPVGEANGEEFSELAKALAEFARKVNVALGEECFDVQDITDKAVEELSCPNLAVAAVLAIEPVVWQQVLAPETSSDAVATGAWKERGPGAAKSVGGSADRARRDVSRGFDGMLQLCAEQSEGCERVKRTGDLKSMPTNFGFKVQTDAQWSGLEPAEASAASSAAFRRVLSCETAEVVLCAESAEERRRWLQDIATELRRARARCLRSLVRGKFWRYVPSSENRGLEVYGISHDWGHEALLAEGLQNEHNANRYALALQALDLRLGSMNVTTVDLARVFRENIQADDVVVMRMDCEGAEYELLRHLLLHGWLCRLRRLYLEAHAMSQPKLNKFRTFDVLLPWLLEPCDTEVFVDTNYHSTYESRMLWPMEDGVCRQCPLLYVPFQGASKRVCPAAAVRSCFDETYTCERCCNVKFGPRGDQECWRRDRPFELAKRLPSGSAAYPVPEDVLQRMIDATNDLSPEAEGVILSSLGPQAPEPNPRVFSYEMCCAGMVSELAHPHLANFIHLQNEGEYWSQDKELPVFARPAQATSKAAVCATMAGLYEAGSEAHPVEVRLGRTTGVTAAGAWAARLELADLLESGADPREIIRAIRAGEEEGVSLGIFSEHAAPADRDPGETETPPPRNREMDPPSVPPGDFESPEESDWELVTARQRSIFDTLESERDRMPPWARPAHPEGPPPGPPSVGSSSAAPAASRETKRTEGARTPPGNLFGTGESRVDFPKPAKPPPKSAHVSFVEMRSQAPVEKESVEPERVQFPKPAKPPMESPSEPPPREKESSRIRGSRLDASMADREAKDMNRYQDDTMVIYDFFKKAGVEMDLTEIVEPKGVIDQTRFDLLTRPNRASTGLGYSRMMKRFIKWRGAREDLGERKGGPDARMGILDFIEYLAQKGVGYMTPKTFLYAWEYYSKAFGFVPQGGHWGRAKRLSAQYAQAAGAHPQRAPGFMKATLMALEAITLDKRLKTPQRVAAGKLRLCVQASIRYNDLLNTPLGCCEWVCRPGQPGVIGLRARSKRGKTGPRLWVASLRGVTPEGDGWLEELMTLLLEAHGPRWEDHDHTGKLPAPDDVHFTSSPSRLEVDVGLVKEALGNYKEEGHATGLSPLGLGALRWHGAKATMAALMQHLHLPARVVRFQGSWHSKEDNMADLYVRESQVIILEGQEKCLSYLRKGGDLQTLIGSPLGDTPVPQEDKDRDGCFVAEAMAESGPRAVEASTMIPAFLDEVFNERCSIDQKKMDWEQKWVPDKAKLEAMLVEEEPETPGPSDLDDAPMVVAKGSDEVAIQDALDAADFEGMVEGLVQAKAATGAAKLHLPKMLPDDPKLPVEPGPRCGIRGSFDYILAEEAIDNESSLCLRCWPTPKGTERGSLCSGVCGHMALSIGRHPVVTLRCSRSLGSQPHEDHKCLHHADA
eukprot:s364_g32.t1